MDNLYKLILLIVLFKPLLLYVEISIGSNNRLSLDGLISATIIVFGFFYTIMKFKYVLTLPSFKPFLFFLVYSGFSIFYVGDKLLYFIKMGRIASYFFIYIFLTKMINSEKRVNITINNLMLSYCFFCLPAILMYNKYDIYQLESLGITSKNTFGILTALLGLFFLGQMSTRSKKGIFWLKNIFLILLFLMLIFSYTRTAWLGFITGFIILFFKSKNIKMNFAYFLLFILIIIFLWSYISIGTQDLEKTSLYRSSYYENSLEGRIFLYFPQAIENWAKRPLFGHGLGSTKILQYSSQLINKPPHNEYLQILQELGLVGLLLFLYYLLSNFIPIYKVLNIKIKNEKERLNGIFMGFLGAFIAFVIMSFGQETFSNGTIGSFYIIIMSISHSCYLLVNKQN